MSPSDLFSPFVYVYYVSIGRHFSPRRIYQMEIFAVILGVGIGYAIYRKNHKNREDDYEEESFDSGYTTRNIPYDEPRPVASADELKEINEAIRAGERALDSLDQARRQLDSARNWGIYDMIGGGMISSIVKHTKIDNANEWMSLANRDLRNFARELRDIRDEDLQIDTGSLVSMLDIFCDNFFSDIMVQKKINNARARIDDLSDRVYDAVQALKRRAMA